MSDSNLNKDFVSLAVAAATLGVSTKTVERYIRDGKIRGRKEGALASLPDVQLLKTGNSDNVFNMSDNPEGKTENHALCTAE